MECLKTCRTTLATGGRLLLFYRRLARYTSVAHARQSFAVLYPTALRWCFLKKFRRLFFFTIVMHSINWYSCTTVISCLVPCCTEMSMAAEPRHWVKSTASIPAILHSTSLQPVAPLASSRSGFEGQGGRWRRRFDDSPHLSLTNYTAMMARRVEAQVRWDWDLNPGLHSLSFASKVNKSVGIGLRKGLSRLTEAHEEPSDTNVGLAMKRLYEMLQDGEYKDDSGKRKPIKGDMSKLHRLIGMSPLQSAIVRNMFFMSARIEGTRQIRKMIGHVITGGRVVYGLPVFMTVTPSERHSGLAIRLSRYRRNDPGVRVGNPEFLPYAGYDAPSLYGPDNQETAFLDLPEYDLRRLMTNRDPLCCLYAFLVNVKVILPNFYGFLATEG